MASKQQTNVSHENARVQRTTQPKALSTSNLVQPVQTDPLRMMPADVINLSHTLGNQTIARMLQKRSIQMKLKVGAAHDAYEQEADRVAAQVMSAPNEPKQPVQRSGGEEEEEIQTKPLASTISRLVQRHADQEEMQTKLLVQRAAEEEEEIQTKGSHLDGFEASDAVEQTLQASKESGSLLPGETREFMESRFGADFAQVRVHADGQSAQLNRQVQAQAFTQGQDIYMGEGKYNPGSTDGRQLIAHELTHTIQQGAAPVRNSQRKPALAKTSNPLPIVMKSAAQRRASPGQFIMSPGFTLQRHAQGEELPNKDNQVSEVDKKEKMAPEATRSLSSFIKEKNAGKKAGTAFTNSQKLSPGAMSLASAEKILQGAYGGIKKIVPGAIVILADQPACSAKYDEVCMNAGVLHEGVPWQPGDCAKDDVAGGVTTEGFAWEGVVYVNGQTTLVTATAHEILHNNTEPNFRATVGETFNEGVTETLARKALTATGVKVPSVTAYPEQVKLAKLLIDFVGMDTVQKAYFSDVQGLVKAFERKSDSTWEDLKDAAEGLDTDKVKAALKRSYSLKKLFGR